MLLYGIYHLWNALVFDSGCFKNGNTPEWFGFVMHAPSGIETEQHSKFRNGLVGTGFITFADDKNIGNFEDTSFDSLHLVAHAWGADYEDSLCGAHDFDLGLTGANGLDNNGVIACRVHCSYYIAGRGGKTTEAATTRHATNEDVGIASQFHHADAVTENGTAGKRTGRVNGNHADFAIAAAQFAHKVRHQRTFARSWCAGHANNMRFTGMLMQFSKEATGVGRIVFNQRDHTRQRTAITIQEAFYDVLQGTPIPLPSGDPFAHCGAQIR